MSIKNSEFKTHKLNEAGLDECRQIASLFDEMLNDLEYLCQPSREFSLVKTKLEEACFFAKKSVCINPKNQEAINGN